MYDNFFIHSSVDGHLGCFHVQATINSATMNTGIVVFSGCVPSNGNARSYGSFIPSFLRNLHTILHSGCYQFTFPPTVQKGSIFSTLSSIYCL